MSSVSVTFEVRSRALEPSCVVGVGFVARALARRVLSRDDGDLGVLRGIASADILVLLGVADTLPWVDGVTYLGCDPEAPRLLLPTLQRPTVPVGAFERALLRRAQGIQGPIAVLIEPPRLIPIAEARPLERQRLHAWLEGL
jgi:MoxR-vWA-beta-propeller ternary system domain bpX5